MIVPILGWVAMTLVSLSLYFLFCIFSEIHDIAILKMIHGFIFDTVAFMGAYLRLLEASWAWIEPVKSLVPPYFF